MISIIGAILGFTVFLIFLSCVARFEYRTVEDYLESHPSLTDEEFLALCDPEIDPTISLKVREILADASGIDEEQIYPDARIIPDLFGTY